MTQIETQKRGEHCPSHPELRPGNGLKVRFSMQSLVESGFYAVEISARRL